MALFLADGKKGFQGRSFFFYDLYKGILWIADGPGSKDLRVKAKTIKINEINNSTSILKFMYKTHITCFSEVC